MFAVKNLIEKNDLNTPQRLQRLKELGADRQLETYMSKKHANTPGLREASRSAEE